MDKDWDIVNFEAKINPHIRLIILPISSMNPWRKPLNAKKNNIIEMAMSGGVISINLILLEQFLLQFSHQLHP